jgi:hypothetical protein
MYQSTNHHHPQDISTYHRSNDQPIIHTPRPLQMKSRPQPRSHHQRGHNTHGNDARRCTPVPGLRINVVGLRPSVVRAVSGRKQRRQWVWSHAAAPFVETTPSSSERRRDAISLPRGARREKKARSQGRWGGWRKRSGVREGGTGKAW